MNVSNNSGRISSICHFVYQYKFHILYLIISVTDAVEDRLYLPPLQTYSGY